MSSELQRESAPKPRHVPTKVPGQAGGKRDENRRMRVRTLSQAALTLMLAKGIESVTVDEIVRDAGVAKGSFYRYFHDKSELVDSVFEPLSVRIQGAFDTARAAVEAAETDGALTMVYVGLAFTMEQTLVTFPRELLLYLQESHAARTDARRPVHALADTVVEAAIELTHTARERGLLTRVASEVSALLVVGAAERLLYEVLRGGRSLGPPRQVAQAMIQVVMQGLSAERPGARGE